jgi:hypothetical protein
MPHLRMTEALTLDELAEEWNSLDRTWSADACVPEVDLTYDEHETPVIKLGDHAIPLNEDAVDRLCGFYKIPTAFFGRITVEERQYVLSHRIQHAPGEIEITYNRTGVTDVRTPAQSRLEPEQFIDVAARLYPGAEVIDYWATADDLRLDIACTTELHGVHQGLRIHQNRKQNLAPTIAPLLIHAASTSVLQVPDPSLKVTVKKRTAEQVVEQLYGEGLRAGARFRSDVESLEALRHESIAEDRIQRLHRVADEHGLPVRQLAELTATLSATDEPTLYDLAITIANVANSPKLADPSKRGARTRLQTIAGALVTDHADRCTTCHAIVPTAA